MNKVLLLGYVGRDPEIQYVGKRPVAQLSLATNEPPRVLPDGSVAEAPTEWHRLVMWDQNAEIAEKYIRKGTRLFVEGQLRTRTWQDRNTIKHTVTEILVTYMDIIK